MRVLVTAFKMFMMTAYLDVIVCVLTNMLHGTLSGEKGSINITRDDYNLALSKWQLQGAPEYEMVVEYGGNGCGPGDAICGTWTLRVSGRKILVLGYRSEDNPG